MAPHLARQVHVKRACLEFQRQLKRRVPEQNAVLTTRRGTNQNQHMEGRLQPKRVTIITGQSHAHRIRHENGVVTTGRMRSK